MRSNSLLPTGIGWYTLDSRVFSYYIQRICRLDFSTKEISECKKSCLLSLFPDELLFVFYRFGFIDFRIKFLINISPKSKLHGCFLGFKADKKFISLDSKGKIQNIFSSLSRFSAKMRKPSKKDREFSC